MTASRDANYYDYTGESLNDPAEVACIEAVMKLDDIAQGTARNGFASQRCTRARITAFAPA